MKPAYEKAGGVIPIGMVYARGVLRLPMMLRENLRDPSGAVAPRGLASAAAYLALRGTRADGSDIIPNADIDLNAAELAIVRDFRPGLVLLPGAAKSAKIRKFRPKIILL